MPHEILKPYQLTERAAYKSRRSGNASPACLQFSIDNGNPPPGNRQYFQLGGRECLPAVEEMLAWDNGNWKGKSKERLALQIIGQHISVLFQDQLDDAEVSALIAAWLEWARKPEAPAGGPK